MTDGAVWRRLLPPPRRRVGILAIVVRWRVELALVMVIAVIVYHAGALVAEISGGVLLVLVTTLSAGRSAAVGAFQLLAVPHRLRSAFLNAGVASRTGHLPWIFWARPVGRAVEVGVGLRSGIAVDDLRHAVPVMEVACGAAQIDVVTDPARPDRVRVVVVRPRRGLL